MWFIGVEVEQERVHPLLKKILDPPLAIVPASDPVKKISATATSANSDRRTEIKIKINKSGQKRRLRI